MSRQTRRISTSAERKAVRPDPAQGFGTGQAEYRVTMTDRWPAPVTCF
jgi:hypothetical protein